MILKWRGAWRTAVAKRWEIAFIYKNDKNQGDVEKAKTGTCASPATGEAHLHDRGQYLSPRPRHECQTVGTTVFR